MAEAALVGDRNPRDPLIRTVGLRPDQGKSTEIPHWLTAGITIGAMPFDADTVFERGRLQIENLLGTRLLRWNRRRFDAASEPRHRKPGRQQSGRDDFSAPPHPRPISLRRARTVAGAGPPVTLRRTSDFSAVKIPIASGPNTFEWRRKSS